jgi:hypothetical protein
MSNRWITWHCIACPRRVTVAWVVEPGWPSGVVHERASYCAGCFAKLGVECLVVDDAVRARHAALVEAVAERLRACVPTLAGRPKERFLALGLSDAGARAAAEAWGRLQTALDSKKKRARADADVHLRDAAMASLEPALTVLEPAEAELLRRLVGPTATPEDSAAVPLLVGTPHVPASLARRGEEPPVEGEHGVFYVLGEERRIMVPPDAGRELRVLAEALAPGDPEVTAALDGSLGLAVLAHERAEAAHGGVAGLLAEREAAWRDPAVLRVLDRIRGGDPDGEDPEGA